MATPKRLAALGRVLVGRPRSRGFWPGLPPAGVRFTRRQANRFLLGASIDYQVKADVAWERARAFVVEMGDPESVWRALLRRYSRRAWMKRWAHQPIHRFPKGHERVWRLAGEIVRRYDGDARVIWQGQGPKEVLGRLLDIRFGPQLSRMVVGALIDKRQIRGSGDVKADVHVRRVLGRLMGAGRPSPLEVTRLTRLMWPRNPWRLDQPLYQIGKDFCYASRPACGECTVIRHCAHARRRGRA